MEGNKPRSDHGEDDGGNQGASVDYAFDDSVFDDAAFAAAACADTGRVVLSAKVPESIPCIQLLVCALWFVYFSACCRDTNAHVGQGGRRDVDCVLPTASYDELHGSTVRRELCDC